MRYCACIEIEYPIRTAEEAHVTWHVSGESKQASLRKFAMLHITGAGNMLDYGLIG